MLDKIWRFLKQLIQRLFGTNPKIEPTTPQPAPTLTDAEYEAKLMELLEGVNQGWGRGDVAEFLIAKQIKNGDLAAWLRGFGDRLLEGAQGSTASTDAVVSLQELARRLELLGRVAGGELSEAAGNVGREILVEFPLVSGEGGEDVNGEAEAWYDRGEQQRNLGQFEEATDSYNQAIALKSDYHMAFSNRGLAQAHLGQFEEAIDSYNQAISLKPHYRAFCNRGISKYFLKQFEEAIDSYKQAIALKPDLHQAFFNLGLTQSKLGKFEEAIGSYNQAIVIKPDNHEAFSNRGLAELNLGKFEEAITSCDKALEFKPDEHKAWNNRGSALDDLGLLEDAIASYDKALEFKPDYHEAWNNRGSALGKLERFEEAITSFDKALEFKPDEHEAWINRGISVKNAPGYYNQLVYEILQGQFPNSPPVTRTLLTHNLKQRGYEGQVLTLKAGLEYCLQNTHPEGYGKLHQALGDAHYSRGKLNSPNTYWNKAVTSYQEALKTLTPDTFLQLHLQVL